MRSEEGSVIHNRIAWHAGTDGARCADGPSVCHELEIELCLLGRGKRGNVEYSNGPNAGRCLDRGGASKSRIQYRLFTFRKICREPSDMVAVVIVSHRRRKYSIEATLEGVWLPFAPRLGEKEI
jgi:hypothetical protein